MEVSENTEPELLPLECDTVGAKRLITAGAQLIDVRQPYEFEAARIPGATLVGLEDISARRDEIDRDRKVLFYCRVGGRSLMAAQAFEEAGFDVVSLAGGIEAWIEAGLDIEPNDGYVAEPGQAAAILESRSRAEKD